MSAPSSKRYTLAEVEQIYARYVHTPAEEGFQPLLSLFQPPPCADQLFTLKHVTVCFRALQDWTRFVPGLNFSSWVYAYLYDTLKEDAHIQWDVVPVAWYVDLAAILYHVLGPVWQPNHTWRSVHDIARMTANQVSLFWSHFHHHRSPALPLLLRVAQNMVSSAQPYSRDVTYHEFRGDTFRWFAYQHYANAWWCAAPVGIAWARRSGANALGANLLAIFFKERHLPVDEHAVAFVLSLLTPDERHLLHVHLRILPPPPDVTSLRFETVDNAQTGIVDVSLDGRLFTFDGDRDIRQEPCFGDIRDTLRASVAAQGESMQIALQAVDLGQHFIPVGTHISMSAFVHRIQVAHDQDRRRFQLHRLLPQALTTSGSPFQSILARRAAIARPLAPRGGPPLSALAHTRRATFAPNVLHSIGSFLGLYGELPTTRPPPPARQPHAAADVRSLLLLKEGSA